jgi:hypothetical protein
VSANISHKTPVTAAVTVALLLLLLLFNGGEICNLTL